MNAGKLLGWEKDPNWDPYRNNPRFKALPCVPVKVFQLILDSAQRRFIG
jgi:hypothetical protein